MRGSQVQAMEEDGILEYDEARNEWVEKDEDGIFMHTIDRHDSDAEDHQREAADDEPFDAMRDAGMSYRDFF